ncbi:MAG: response regulator [Thermoanaerobaculia bacterium]
MARMLIVDDEALMRRLIALCLKDLGHDIRQAGDARAGLAALAEAPADLVFCDVQMPGEDGVWLTGQIRNRYPMTAVILMTGLSTKAPATHMQKGVLACLVKPFRAKELIDATAIALRWVEDLESAGPQPDDVGDKLAEWLESLDLN